MKTKLNQTASQQHIILAAVAVIALLLLLAIFASSSIDSGGLSTKIYRPAPQTPSTKCTDGTSVNSCSRTKPYMCTKLNNTLTFQQNCAKCGCPSGLKCVAGKCTSGSSRGY